MHHFIPTLFLMIFALVYLAFRYSIDAAFIFTSPFPSAAYLIAYLHEIMVGLGPFNERVLHIAYDSSYILVLVGLLIALRALLTGGNFIYIAIATGLAAFPLSFLGCCCPN